tara:strand:+ start:2444 stop:2740 length:297 start_codon:yes stop_codon:yes gene_type:complete
MTEYEIKFDKPCREEGFLTFSIHPNYINTVDGYTASTYRKDVRDTAARLYFITNLLPNLKGRDLLLIAEGDYTLEIDEDSDEDYYIALLTTGVKGEEE